MSWNRFIGEEESVLGSSSTPKLHAQASEILPRSAVANSRSLRASTKTSKNNKTLLTKYLKRSLETWVQVLETWVQVLETWVQVLKTILQVVSQDFLHICLVSKGTSLTYFFRSIETSICRPGPGLGHPTGTAKDKIVTPSSTSQHLRTEGYYSCILPTKNITVPLHGEVWA